MTVIKTKVQKRIKRTTKVKPYTVTLNPENIQKLKKEKGITNLSQFFDQLVQEQIYQLYEPTSWNDIASADGFVASNKIEEEKFYKLIDDLR